MAVPFFYKSLSAFIYLHFPHQMPQSTNLTEEEVWLVRLVELQFQGWVPLPSRHPNLCNKICIKYSKKGQPFFLSTINCVFLDYLDQKLAFSLVHVYELFSKDAAMCKMCNFETPSKEGEKLQKSSVLPKMTSWKLT